MTLLFVVVFGPSPLSSSVSTMPTDTPSDGFLFSSPSPAPRNTAEILGTPLAALTGALSMPLSNFDGDPFSNSLFTQQHMEQTYQLHPSVFSANTAKFPNSEPGPWNTAPVQVAAVSTRGFL